MGDAGRRTGSTPTPPDTQHGDMNKGTEPMEVIVVELKNDVKK